MDTIEQLAKKHYEDGSHGWDHIQEVLSRAKALKGSPLEDYERAAILFHDSSLSTGPRETHDVDSSLIARKELAGLYRKRLVNRIANAIARHRASYKGRRYTFLDNLLASADRDNLDLNDMLYRSYRYGKDLGQSEEEALNHAISHIPEKYGRTGYAFKGAPKLYLQKNKDRLENFWRSLEKMDPEKIRHMIAQRSES